MRRAGTVYKRCPCGITGTGKKPPCRQEHGSWWWRAEAQRDASTGKRKQPGRGGYADAKAAQTALNEHLDRQSKGTWADDKRTTVGEWLTKWLEACERRGLEPKTLAGYESHVRTVLIPALGHHRLRDLQRHHVEEMIDDLKRPTTPPRRDPPAAGEKPKCEATTLAGDPCSRTAAAGSAFCGAHGGRLSGEKPTGPGRGGRVVQQRMPRTLDGYRRTLRAALASAKLKHLVEENVAEGRIETMPRIGRADTSWWEPEQVATFLYSNEEHRLYPLFMLAAFGGLRRGELLGLRWTDVDLEGAVPGLVVNQTLSGLAGRHPCVVCGGTHTGRRIKVKPKTDAGRRWVPLVSNLVAALTAHREKQDADRERFGDAWSEHGLVFTQEDGVPLRPDAVTREFEALAGDLPKIRLHDQRHGAASLLLAAGVPIEVVAQMLGHANPQVTRGVYGHTMKGPALKGMEAAAALVHLPTSLPA